MVNEELIEARIREMNDAMGLLKRITSTGFEDLSIYERLSLRYLVIQLVEAASGICLHVLMDAYNERAEGYPECFIRLGEKGFMPEGLARRLALAARLRNLLVHRYWTIDDRKVYESVRRGLRDFEDFLRYVRDFLKKRG